MSLPINQATLSFGAGIVKLMMTKFDKLMSQLAADQRNNVIYVRTQGTLTTPHQWANELHPSPDGFTLIAQKFQQALSQLPRQPALSQTVGAPK